MQSISPLTSTDFKNKSNVVIGKVEIDSDGAGTYLELPDIIDFSINTNIENQVGRLSSYSFSIIILNTDDQFNPYNARSSYYDYLRQGRRIKLWTGIKTSDAFIPYKTVNTAEIGYELAGSANKKYRRAPQSYYYQTILGRIDEYRLEKLVGQNICTITGRDFMRIITEYRLYSPNTYWGANETLNTVSGQVRYNLNVSCKGIYIAYLDSTSPYDGSNLEEIYENQDWGYDWHNNQFCFAEQRIPDFAGTNNLKVYYMTIQTVENVVGHILYVAGIFANITERDAWIANASYVTPTSKTIDRIWFNTGTSALEAIRLLSEVVQYRLYFDYAGNPIFKPKASIGTIVDTIDKSDITIENIEENEEETYTHIIVEGEKRDRILGDDETAPAVPSNLALTTGFGEATQAGLAYIKATWDANTEIDFGHYELRIKKNADSDYSEVSTIATTYMFLGLEPGVTYNVQIRACDIYENRSNWSTAENQVTATDSTTPAQITGVTVTALFAGIKVNWTQATENNISYYLVERQESPDNVDWSGAWVEKVRTSATMWLDLLLTYSKYYRYRVTAYTVTGIAGTTSAVSSALQPNQAATTDIEAGAITATELATNAVIEGKINAGAVTEGKIGSSAVTAIKIAADAVIEAKINALAVTATKIATNAVIEGKINASAVTTTKLDTGAVTAIKIAADAVIADKILAGAVGTDKLAALAVTADKIAANTITADEIAGLTITAAEIAASAITTAKINALAVTTDCLAALAVTAAKIAAGTITANEIAAGTITTTEIAANTIVAGNIAAGAVDTSELAAGAVTAVKIEAGTITTTQIAAGTIVSGDIANGTITGTDIAATTITGSKIVTGTITATQLAANSVNTSELVAQAVTAAEIKTGTITATQIASNAITTVKLNANAVTAAKIAAGTITATQIASNAITTIKLNAQAVTAAKITTGTITATQIAASTITGSKIAATTITAGNIATNAITSAKILADAVTATKINVTSLAAVSATLGSVSAGNIQGTRIQIGGGTNEDIYFEDSGIRLYDLGSTVIRFYKSATQYMDFDLGASVHGIYSKQPLNLASYESPIRIISDGRNFYFHSGGTLEMPILTSQPTAHSGDIAIEDSGAGDDNNRFHYYTTNAGWQYMDDNDGW